MLNKPYDFTGMHSYPYEDNNQIRAVAALEAHQFFLAIYGQM